MSQRKDYQLKTRADEALMIATETRAISPLTLPEISPAQMPPQRLAQKEILNTLLQGKNPGEYMKETFSHPYTQGLNRQELLMELITMQMAREFALAERRLLLENKLPFYVHTAGMETHQIAVQRWLTNHDAYLPYYRGQAADLYRGGSPEDLLAQDLHRTGDTHSRSRQLGGHIASLERGTIPAISITGPNLLPAVGIGTALNNRREHGMPGNNNFQDKSAIAVAELGDATFAQGEVKEAITQAVKDKSATVIVGYNNLAGISMSLGDSSVDNDPILFARSFTDHGLNIAEVDGTKPVDLVKTTRSAITHTRNRRLPSLVLINNIFRLTDHTSSSNQDWYTPPEELERRKQFDILPKLQQLFVEIGVLTEADLARLTQATRQRIDQAVNEVLGRPTEDPSLVYKDVYSSKSKFGPKQISSNPAVPTVDHLQSSRTAGIDYTDKKRPGFQITGRLYENLVLAQEMRRDPRIVVYGEDVGTLTKDGWDMLPEYFKQKVEQKADKLTPEQIERGYQALKTIEKGYGFEEDPENLAAFAGIIDGKGGVFRITQFLDFLYGKQRSFNFPISEAGIIGTATGRALAGEIPVVEIQFDAYTSPAYQQIHDYLSTLRWRGGGQFGAGMVIRMQGMNRVGGNGIDKAGGIGGIGHGAADISRFIVPGLRHFIPGDVEDMGAGLREAIRVAREHQDPVLVYEPINLYSDKGNYQGAEAHIPLGEAEVVRSGKDLTFLTWSNNVRIAKALANTLGLEGYDVGVINARALGDQFDWDTVVPEIEKANKVMIFEAGRKDGGLLAGQLQQQLFEQLDAPVVWHPARFVPMPAGEENEAYVVPQYSDVLDRARQLIRY